jgi:UDP-N-acetylglucosamine pyrophosphorylase
MPEDHFVEFKTKMRQAGMHDAIVNAFQHSYALLKSGDSGLIPESSIQPVTHLPRLTPHPGAVQTDPALLAQTAIVKLNGGLGTSMGLDSPKSLLWVKSGLNFLDIISGQIRQLRQTSGVRLRFLLMNSFSTSAPTREWLQHNRTLGNLEDIELMQNSIPKVDARTLRPASWPAQPELEWCPPGHGDLYPSLLGSGWLERLLGEGVQFLFVSNVDNLGATLDSSLLKSFAESGKPFLMEVCERTAADRKGGHLAERNGQLLLRESAQCPQTDQTAFQDISRHRFFNTNNLWLRLDRLKELLQHHGGLIPLPVISNSKTLDPRDATSPKIIQLETAMGSAIECFAGAGAIVVPRSRFAPVKATSDLLAVRSDAYALTPGFQVVLDPSRNHTPPSIELDPKHYRMVDQLDARLGGAAPSLKHCESLTVEGPVDFNGENTFCGKVRVINPGAFPAPLPPGVYQDTTVTLKP